MSDERSLWVSRDEAHAFLVPDSLALEPGDYALKNLFGEERTCARAALDSFEVTPEDAQAHLLGRIGSLFGELPKKLEEMIGGAVEETGSPQAEPEDIASGLRFNHVVEMQTKQRLSEVAATLDALVETLKASGVVDETALAARQKEATRKEGERIRSDALVVLSDVPDKYALTGLPEIDCEARIPLCRARCCTLAFALSTQDLDERKIRWEYGRPYQIARRTDGYCVHNDAQEKTCEVYEARPASCRTYDCRTDKRIWLDFDRRLPA